MLDEVRQAAYRIIAGKGATNFAIGVVAARVIEAVTRNERRVLPITTYHDDYLGIEDVCMSVPTIVGREGAAATLRVPDGRRRARGPRRLRRRHPRRLRRRRRLSSGTPPARRYSPG